MGLLGWVFGWVFGIIFLVSGIVLSLQGLSAYGIIIILLSFLILPFTHNLIKRIFSISGILKFIIGIAVVLLIVTAIGKLPYKKFQAETALQETNASIEGQETLNETLNLTDKTYEDLWAVFDPKSKYTVVQKENIFDEEYKGNYVKWTGTVKEADISILNNLRLYAEHRKKGALDFRGGDVKVYIRKDQYDKLVGLHKGDQVTYIARVNSYFKFMGYYFTLIDGRIE